MLEILWTLINLGILIWLIILFTRAIKLIGREYNKASAAILFLGITLLVLGGWLNKKEIDDFPPKNTTEYLTKEIHFSPINRLVLLVAADTINQEYNYKTKLTSTFKLLISPISWKHIMGGVTKTDTGYSYQILGLKEWNLLSLKIYSQKVDLNGEINSKI